MNRYDKAESLCKEIGIPMLRVPSPGRPDKLQTFIELDGEKHKLVIVGPENRMLSKVETGRVDVQLKNGYKYENGQYTFLPEYQIRKMDYVNFRAVVIAYWLWSQFPKLDSICRM